jgi:ATP-dependent RNA helicase DeaD
MLTREASVASFGDLRLRPETIQALTSMDITTPTPIQSRALRPLLDGRDLIGQARTGSGKTLAFGIPAIELADPRAREIQVLVLVPTRELAVQVGGVLDDLGRRRNLSTVLIFGGRAAGPQIAALRRGAPIVVGTPGRIVDLLNQGVMDISRLRMVVLDEADEMLDQGFAPDVERILKRAPRQRQTVLFSATVPGWVDETSRTYLDNPIHVSVDPRPEDSAPIDHVAYDIPDGDKLTALRDLLDHRGDGSIIVFGRTKHGVKKLARKLEEDGYPVGALQGNLSQNARDRVMEDFRSGKVQILLATNVAARGLDITSIDQVINVDLPESPELLTHRVGRTGRMGRKGQAITLLGPEDGPKWRQLERGLGRQITRATWRGAIAAMSDSPTPVAPRTSRPAAAIRREELPARRTPQPAAVLRREEPQVRPATSTRHDIVCSACGQRAEVPFQPDPSRPVYCAACFSPRRRPRR